METACSVTSLILFLSIKGRGATGTLVQKTPCFFLVLTIALVDYHSITVYTVYVWQHEVCLVYIYLNWPHQSISGPFKLLEDYSLFSAKSLSRRLPLQKPSDPRRGLPLGPKTHPIVIRQSPLVTERAEQRIRQGGSWREQKNKVEILGTATSLNKTADVMLYSEDGLVFLLSWTKAQSTFPICGHPSLPSDCL